MNLFISGYIIVSLVTYAILMTLWVKGWLQASISFEQGRPLPGWCMPVGLWVVALLWPLVIVAFIQGRINPD